MSENKRPVRKKSQPRATASPVKKAVKNGRKAPVDKVFSDSKRKKPPVKRQKSFDKNRQSTPKNQQKYDFYGRSINGEYDDRYYDETAIKNLRKKKKGKGVSRSVIRLRKIFVSFLIVLVVLVVGITLSLTVFFKTADYEITGKTRYTKEEIVSACGIKEGENIFLANKEAGEEKIINTFPYIAEADVTFGLPDKIVINIKEGKPCYVVKFASKQFCVVSEEGRILKVTKKRVKGLPIVKGVTIKSNIPGEYVEYKDDKNSKTLINLVTSIVSCGFKNLSEINVSKKSKITFTYDKRILVLLGLPENIDYKVRTAKAIITDKLDPNNTGMIAGTLDVSSCKETKRSYFNEKPIISEEEKTSTTVPATDIYGNAAQDGGSNGYTDDYSADYNVDYNTDYNTDYNNDYYTDYNTDYNSGYTDGYYGDYGTDYGTDYGVDYGG